jgi:predicted dehydrogenase
MNQKVNVGIVGTRWGANIHGTCLSKNENAKIVAICGRNRERNEEVADQLKAEKIYTDYHDLLNHGGLDAVIVATPDDTHFPIVMAAIDAGVHILCEKPLASNADQAEKMWRKAEAKGIQTMTFFSWHWIPHFIYLKTLVEEGYIGTCYDFIATWHLPFSLNPQTYAWRHDAERSSGTIADLGSHFFYIVLNLLGEIDWVQASLMAYTEKPSKDGKPTVSSSDSAIVTFHTKEKTHGMVNVSTVAGGGSDIARFLLIGSEGTLDLRGLDKEFLLKGKRCEENSVETFALPKELDALYANAETAFDKFFMCLSNGIGGAASFVDSIIKDEPASPSFRDGYKVQKIIDAAVASDREGCRIKID